MDTATGRRVEIGVPDDIVATLEAEGLASRMVRLQESRSVDAWEAADRLITVLGAPATIITFFVQGRRAWRRLAELLASWRADAPDPPAGKAYKLGAGRRHAAERFDLTDPNVDVEQLTLWLEEHGP